MSDIFDADRTAEAYARALVEATRSSGGSKADAAGHRQGRAFSHEVLETLSAMLEAGDLGLIDRVAQTYKDILDSGDETVSVTVTTAVPLDDHLRAKVRGKAERDLQAPVFLIEKVDPSMLGGIILELRGKRFDASVRTQLADIRKTLVSAHVESEG